jgi:hypothetical protein
MKLTLEKRFNWMKSHKPKGYTEKLRCTWGGNVEINLKGDMYSFSFNHPYYFGNSGMTDDEVRHILLDELGVPKYKITHKTQFAVYEKEPAHGKDKDGVILAPYSTKEEAETAGKTYGYYGDNYYVDVLINKT